MVGAREVGGGEDELGNFYPGAVVVLEGGIGRDGEVVELGDVLQIRQRNGRSDIALGKTF